MNKFSSPSVYYRMPHKREVWFIQSDSDAVKIDSLNNVPAKPGFILYPFSKESKAKPYFISADKHTSVSSVNGQWDMKDFASNDFSKTKDEYCKNVVSAIDLIQSGKIRKVVLSWVKTMKSPAPIDPAEIFNRLCIKYPAAFISLVYIPDDVLWITATPELLVSANGSKIGTVSLAGTKPVDNTGEWGVKEKDEQQVVTDYINAILKKYCSNIVLSRPEETIAGNIKHLKTSFSASLNTGFWSFVSELHPTPAVCGIPLNTAEQFIDRTEGYDRKYYAGFLGPCNIAGKTDLFVNLRCAELFSDGVNMYIGGGITKNSIPEKEWEETELKSETLLFSFAENEKE